MTIMNRTATAAALGIAKTTLDSWVAEGAPVVSREGRKGVETQYDTAEVLRWWMAREAAKAERRADPKDLDAIRARKLQIEADAKALDLLQARGLVAPIEEMSRAVIHAFEEVKANMRNVPSRVATRLVGEVDEAKIKAVLLAEIDQTLTTLGNKELVNEEMIGGKS